MNCSFYDCNFPRYHGKKHHPYRGGLCELHFKYSRLLNGIDKMDDLIDLHRDFQKEASELSDVIKWDMAIKQNQKWQLCQQMKRMNNGK